LSIIIPVEIIDILSRMVKRITDENWGVDISEGKWGNEGGERRREGEEGKRWELKLPCCGGSIMPILNQVKWEMGEEEA
jgi:hypothetical protein